MYRIYMYKNSLHSFPGVSRMIREVSHVCNHADLYIYIFALFIQAPSFLSVAIREEGKRWVWFNISNFIMLQSFFY